MLTLERIIELHRLYAKCEQRMHMLMRRIVDGDESPETYMQYVNAYAHMITVRKIRTGNGENS